MGTVAVLVVITTDDPLLQDDNRSVATATATARLRQAVVKALRQDVTRVVLVTSEENARLMCFAHAEAMKAMGEGDLIVRPPSSYRPPRH